MTWTTWPSGSRTRKPRSKPSARSSTRTTPGETSRAPAAVRRAARGSGAELATIVCQWTRSFARSSAGAGRPSRGLTYSRNSIPGPGPLPLRVTLAGRKLEDFERMVVRIPEIEGADPAGVGVPVREALRRWRHPPHAVRLEHGVGAVHVAYDDRHVLEPAVVAARVRRGRTARRSGPGHQLQRVDAEPEANDAHARAGHAL